MSTITVSAAVPASVRLTRRGRLVLTTAFLVVALGLMVALGGFATASLEGGTPPPVRIVEVQEGDTLYGIAGAISEPGEIREAVHAISELNDLDGGTLEPGQRLAVPLD